MLSHILEYWPLIWEGHATEDVQGRVEHANIVIKISQHCFGFFQSKTNEFCATLRVGCQHLNYCIIKNIDSSKLQAQYVSNDPSYLKCNKQECKKYNNTVCEVTTCSGTISFHVINIRTDIEFVFFAGGFETPCILTRSAPMKFSNPNQPLHGHVSSTDSTATSVR